MTTILAIHGWLDNAASFIPLIEQLPEYHWQAIDLVGHGHSSHRPPKSHYHFIDWVTDLHDFIVEMDYQKPPIIVGHSLGGFIATVFAGLFPNLLSRLVLIDAAGLVIQNDKRVIEDMRDAMNLRVGQESKSIKQPQSLKSAIKARQQAGDLSEPAARYLIERNTNTFPDSNLITWRTDHRLRSRSPLRFSKEAAQKIISEINVPLLILLAEEGYDDVKKAYKFFSAHYPSHTQKNVKGNHHCHLEFPAETAEQIRRFLL
mgnify:CR=1 FL=1